jgi:hypothetical protein
MIYRSIGSWRKLINLLSILSIFSNMALFAFSKGAIVDIYRDSFDMVETEVNH